MVYDQDIIAIIRRLDKDDDGIISYKEFLDKIKPFDKLNKLRKSRSPLREVI